MLDPSLIIERLRDEVATFAGRIGGAGALEPALAEQDLAVPAAFVVPLDDEAGASLTAGAPTQVLTESVAVIVAVDNTSDLRGQAAAEQLDTIRTALWAALAGWTPADGYAWFEYREGGLFRIARHRVWWQFVFATDHVI
jgi:hypothetical protein